MKHDSPGPRPWFRAKRYGYGAGLPMAWQGWVVMLAYGAIVAGFSVMLQRTPGAPNWAALAGIAFATALLIWIIASRTEGGLGWRWGDRDPPESR